MCWTLEDYKMTKILLKGLYEEWSCAELSIFQACLEEYDGVDIHVHLQDIIVMNKEEMIQVQVQEKHLEEIICLKLATHLEIMVK